MWKNINNFVFNKKWRDEKDIIQKTLWEWNEYYATNKRDKALVEKDLVAIIVEDDRSARFSEDSLEYISVESKERLITALWP